MYVRVEDENGEPIAGLEWVSDREDIFHKYLGLGDDALPYAGYIDWYTDTVISSFQMEPFIKDWEKILARADQEHVPILLRVLHLAREVDNSTGWHLKFYGD